jgi:hypothetical protein
MIELNAKPGNLGKSKTIRPLNWYFRLLGAQARPDRIFGCIGLFSAFCRQPSVAGTRNGELYRNPRRGDGDRRDNRQADSRTRRVARRHRIPQHGQPDISRSPCPETMGRPLIGLPPAPMVGGDQESGTVLMIRVCLYGIPQVGDHPVDICCLYPFDIVVGTFTGFVTGLGMSRLFVYWESRQGDRFLLKPSPPFRKSAEL